VPRRLAWSGPERVFEIARALPTNLGRRDRSAPRGQRQQERGSGFESVGRDGRSRLR